MLFFSVGRFFKVCEKYSICFLALPLLSLLAPNDPLHAESRSLDWVLDDCEAPVSSGTFATERQGTAAPLYPLARLPCPTPPIDRRTTGHGLTAFHPERLTCLTWRRRKNSRTPPHGLPVFNLGVPKCRKTQPCPPRTVSTFISLQHSSWDFDALQTLRKLPLWYSVSSSCIFFAVTRCSK